MSIASIVRKALRMLTPPGNRPPLEESGDQREAPNGTEPPSFGGQRERTLDSWGGGP